jgi:thiamine-phosphate pyrophosphorylase
MPHLPKHGLYVITTARYPDQERLLKEVGEALRGGAAMVQFRDKSGDTSWRLDTARRLQALCSRHQAPLIINDDVELALACGADGVHLGQEDTEPASARRRLGAGALIGVSCYNRVERARALRAEGVDYLAFGSLFASPTKPSAVPCSLETLAEAARMGLPLVAIGGITAENGGAAIRGGASFLAVISEVFDAPDVRRAAAALAALWPAASSPAQGNDTET